MSRSSSSIASKRRDKLLIIAEILEIAEEGTLKTPILYRANLSFTQLNEYLRVMLNINLLGKVSQNGKDMYQATMKGLDFLQRYHEMIDLVKTVEENNGRNGIRLPPPYLLKGN